MAFVDIIRIHRNGDLITTLYENLSKVLDCIEILGTKFVRKNISQYRKCHYKARGNIKETPTLRIQLLAPVYLSNT